MGAPIEMQRPAPPLDVTGTLSTASVGDLTGSASRSVLNGSTGTGTGTGTGTPRRLGDGEEVDNEQEDEPEGVGHARQDDQSTADEEQHGAKEERQRKDGYGSERQRTRDGIIHGAGAPASEDVEVADDDDDDEAACDAAAREGRACGNPASPGFTSQDEWDAAREDAYAEIARRRGQRRRRFGQLLEERRARHAHRRRQRVELAEAQQHADAQEGSHDADQDTLDEDDISLANRLDDEALEDWDPQSASGSKLADDRSSLHVVDEEQLEDAGRAEDAHRSSEDAHEDDTLVGHHQPQVAESKQMMNALIDEFGPWTASSPDDQGEQWIAFCSAILIRTVVIRGSLMLTNRRMVFVALIPTLGGGEVVDSSMPDMTKPAVGDADDESGRRDIIRHGPCVLHVPGWSRARHVWFELRKETLVCYRDSETLYNPLGSARLQSLKVMPLSYLPPGKTKTSAKRVYIKGPTGLYALEFQTPEAANLWHKDFEAAIWSCNKSRDRVRISIPLERIAEMSAAESDNLRLIKFQVGVILGEGDSSGKASPDVTTTGHETGKGRPRWQGADLLFGVIRSHETFPKQAQEAVDAARRRYNGAGEGAAIRQSPAPIIEVEGQQQRDEALKEAAIQQDGMGLSAKLVELFSLRTKPEDLRVARADLVRTVPMAGTLAIGKEFLIFWRHRLPPFRDIRMKIPLVDLVGAHTSKAFRWHYYGLKVQVHAHPSVLFEFKDKHQRNLILTALKEIVEEHKARSAESKQAERQQLLRHGASEQSDPIQTLLRPTEQPFQAAIPHESLSRMPKVINPSAQLSLTIEPMRIICLTIGSRGDVQPYIALCKGLKAQGHTPIIVSHPEYKDWVNKHGIEFRGAGGDPGALMKLSVEHRLFSPAFFRDSLGKFRGWLDELLREAYEQCWDAELIIESPSTMAGIHIAEALQCYYIRAFTMVWTRTKSFPQAFSVPPVDLGETYNWSSFGLFDRVFWQASSGQINRWRRHMLGLASIGFAELDQDSVPFMYNFSPAVVPHPIDWSDRIAVTGYWFLSSSSEGWQPPGDLIEFMERARQDEKKLVYIGFGSITVPNAAKTTKSIYAAVQKAGVRAIVSKGWSDRMSKSEAGADKDKDKSPSSPSAAEESAPPPEVYTVDQIPHDWLFPRIDIAVHHGGAGTTGASLREGLVTLIHPFFGDQFFWAGRVQKLGAGLKVASLDADDIASALTEAAGNRILVEKAQLVGAKIRSEDGVRNAILFIEAHFSSSKRRLHPLRPAHETSPTLGGTAAAAADKDKDKQGASHEEGTPPADDEGYTSAEEDERLRSEDASVFSRMLSAGGRAATAPFTASFNTLSSWSSLGSISGHRRRSSQYSAAAPAEGEGSPGPSSPRTRAAAHRRKEGSEESVPAAATPEEMETLADVSDAAQDPVHPHAHAQSHPPPPPQQQQQKRRLLPKSSPSSPSAAASALPGTSTGTGASTPAEPDADGERPPSSSSSSASRPGTPRTAAGTGTGSKRSSLLSSMSLPGLPNLAHLPALLRHGSTTGQGGAIADSVDVEAAVSVGVGVGAAQGQSQQGQQGQREGASATAKDKDKEREDAAAARRTYKSAKAEDERRAGLMREKLERRRAMVAEKEEGKRRGRSGASGGVAQGQGQC